MTSAPRAYAYFRVHADTLPLAEITELMGMAPTESWSKGETSPRGIPYRNSGWCLYSPLPQTVTDLSAHIEAVMAQLEGREAAVRSISQRFATYLVCVGWYNEAASPGLGLPKGTVARLADMGMAVDADLYFLGD